VYADKIIPNPVIFADGVGEGQSNVRQKGASGQMPNAFSIAIQLGP